MITIIHKIRLKDGIEPAKFEEWVTGTDYVTAPKLKSLISFGVRRATGHDDFHYFEIINISSMEAFEVDMKTPEFEALVAAFSKMADVVEEIKGEFIAPGYKIN